MKYILVTGGVISGIGKGIIASSIGTILKSCGLHVTSIKIDPYINIDAGTFSPYEHGECPAGSVSGTAGAGSAPRESSPPYEPLCLVLPALRSGCAAAVCPAHSTDVLWPVLAAALGGSVLSALILSVLGGF